MTRSLLIYSSVQGPIDVAPGGGTNLIRDLAGHALQKEVTYKGPIHEKAHSELRRPSCHNRASLTSCIYNRGGRRKIAIWFICAPTVPNGELSLLLQKYHSPSDFSPRDHPSLATT